MGGASADRRPVKGNSKHRGPTRCLHGWGQWGPFDGGWDGGPLERERPWAAHRLLHAAVTAEGCVCQIAMLPPSLLCRSPGRFLLVVSAEGRVSAASDPIWPNSNPSRVRARVLVGFHCSGPGEQLRAVSPSTSTPEVWHLSTCAHHRTAPERPLVPSFRACTASPQQARRLCLTRPARCIGLAASVVHSLQHACSHSSSPRR
jgi:hypothetical protein